MRFHDHVDSDGARGIVEDLNFGVKEQHMVQPLALGDALAYYVEHIWVDNDGDVVIVIVLYARGRVA